MTIQAKIIWTTAFLCTQWMTLPAWAQTSFTLEKSLQTARANNPVLKNQYLNVNIAESDIITAKLRPNLKLNNQTLQSVQSSSYPANTEWNNNRNRQVWWQLTKPIQINSLRQNKIDYAEENVMLQQKLYSETERNVFQDVASKWLDVWTARKQLDILALAKSNIDTLVNINKLRLKNQVITQTDLSRTQLLANQYALQIKSSEQNFKNELANLKFLLGVQEEITIDTTDQFNFQFPAKLDSLLEEALNQRSDIQAYKSGISVANSNIKLQKSLAWSQPEIGVIYNPQNAIPYVGFYGTIDIPTFSRNQGQIKKSYFLKQQAEQNLQTVQVQIQTELVNAFNTYQTQKENLGNFNTVLTQSESILNSVKYAYLRGGTTIIDFLEAQRSWLDTQTQYYETLQQYKQSYIKLLYASGSINKIAQ